MSERSMSGRTIRCDHCHKNFTGNLRIPEDPLDPQSVAETMRPALDKGWRCFMNASNGKLHCFCRRCQPTESGVRWTEFVLDGDTVRCEKRLMVPSASGNMHTKAELPDDKYSPI